MAEKGKKEPEPEKKEKEKGDAEEKKDGDEKEKDGDEEKKDGDEEQDPNNNNNNKQEEQPKPAAAAAAAAAPGIKTLTIQVADGKTPVAPPALAAIPGGAHGDTVAKLLEAVSGGGGLARGSLLTFADRELASLSGAYGAAAPAEYGAKIKEPSDLTEDDWDKVLRNTRALHGYWYDFDKNVLVKASKRGMLWTMACLCLCLPLGTPADILA